MENNSVSYNVFKDTGKNIDTIPLVEADESGNMYIDNLVDANDIEINLNSLTLYPNIDYSIYSPKYDNDSKNPSMIVLRNTIDASKKFTLEIYRLNKGENHSFYWMRPAEGTDDTFTMDDDRLLFIPNTFTVYVNNLLIDINKVSILDTHTIRIIGMEDIKNVLVKFSYSNHTNLQMIFDYYKYRKDNFNEIRNTNYWHRNTNSILPNLFDEFTDNGASNGTTFNDSRNMIMMDKLNNPNETVIIDANKANVETWDTFINSAPFGSSYMKHNEFFNMNEIKNEKYRLQSRVIKDPEI